MAIKKLDSYKIAEKLREKTLTYLQETPEPTTEEYASQLRTVFAEQIDSAEIECNDAWGEIYRDIIQKNINKKRDRDWEQLADEAFRLLSYTESVLDAEINDKLKSVSDSYYVEIFCNCLDERTVQIDAQKTRIDETIAKKYAEAFKGNGEDSEINGYIQNYPYEHSVIAGTRRQFEDLLTNRK